MSQRRTSTLFLITAVLIWASTYVVTKRLLAEAGPFTVTALRFAIGMAVLWLPARRQGFRLRHVFQPDLVTYGMTGIVLFYGLQNLGLQFTSAGSASLINAALPAATAVFSFYLLREKLPALRLAGMALSIAGVLLVSGVPSTNAGGLAIVGNGLVLGSMIAWALYTVQGRRLSLDLPPIVVTTASMGAGLLVLLPLGAVEIWVQGMPRLTGAGWLSLLYLGAAASAMTLFLWNYAIRSVEATVATLYPNLIPLAGLLLAWVGGESVGGVQLLGGFLAMAGVCLSEWYATAPPRHKEGPSSS